MSVGRNDPCPCGSGTKYKNCHGDPSRNVLAPADLTWRRLRAVLDGFPSTMFRFTRDAYGAEGVEEAWAEFVLWDDEDAGFDPDSVHLPVFMPWFFHRWTPDPADTAVVGSLHGRSPTHVLLERRGRKLDPLLRRYLEACVATPFSFHEVVRTRPGEGLHTRDVFTGEEHDVLEHSASRTLDRGDILFGQIVSCDGIAILEASPSVVIPPDEKLPILDLRDRIAEKSLPLTRETLADWDIELREEYLACIDAIMNPGRRRIENTDGEPLEFHRLSFEIPSATEAFDALKHLALAGRGSEAGAAPDADTEAGAASNADMEAEADLLESAEYDEDGQLRRVSFPWLRAGNASQPSWENTVLGHLEIDGERLVAEVNSAGRAARLREIVESAGIEAKNTDTEVESLDEALARSAEADRRPESKRAGTHVDALAPAPTDDPDLRDLHREVMARHYESWINEAIPALGGRTPMEAVQDPSGREKVEALITMIERQGRDMEPPLDEAVTRTLRERLGLAD